jgi:thiamine-phosphate pyrophosphorylase
VAAHAGWSPLDYAIALLDGGASFLQIRAKHAPSGDLLHLCEAVVAAGHACGATVIVNDRADLASLSKADGVHVGQDDLDVEEARRLLGADAIIGLSTHSVDQVASACTTTATYIAVGPVFSTRTKDTGYAAVGPALVRTARHMTTRPIVAIGGVTLENAHDAIDAGATMVAVISDLLKDGDPAARVRAYRARLDRAAG